MSIRGTDGGGVNAEEWPEGEKYPEINGEGKKLTKQKNLERKLGAGAKYPCWEG